VGIEPARVLEYVIKWNMNSVKGHDEKPKVKTPTRGQKKSI
jgi:hypothetical protein